MKIVDTKDKTLPRKDAVIREAHDRFHQASNFEAENRSEALDDLRMLAGRNHWPGDIVRKRDLEGRPHLTINKLPAFTDQVVNDSRLNKIGIKVRPYGGGSTPELAETYNGLIRNIESVSDADVAYQTALEGAVNNGFGYFRIATAFAEDSSFDQELFIRRIRNPMTVYLDHHHASHDGRDIKWAFITEMVSRKEFEARYPKADLTPFGDGTSDSAKMWVEEDRLRIAEYWVLEPTTKRLYGLSDGRTVDGDEWDLIADDLKAAEKMIHLEPNPEDPQGQPLEVPGPAPEGSDFPQTILNPTPTIDRQRKVDTHKVVQYLLGGDQILDGPTEWPGRYIPIIPVWGRELVIDEDIFRRGLIRFAKDPQRMYNYFRTAATETVALTPKAPYIMEEKQVEGHEAEWSKIGVENQPYLLYRGVAGVERPARQVVTQTAIGELTESNVSNDEMKATTSLFDASLGRQGNETSGRAILARQREGDVANFVFHDNLKRAVKFAGDILVDLIPKIYDTERQLAILNEMEEDDVVLVNQTVIDEATGQQVILNDLSAGRYKVTVTTGPSFTTQRVEAAESMLDFVRTAPDTASLVMDLIAENQDWPGALKIAKRLKKLLPPGIDDDQPAPEPPPSVDDMIKELKANSIDLGNTKKRLDIVEKERELKGSRVDPGPAQQGGGNDA